MFAAGVAYPVGNQPFGVRLTDLNGDRVPDIAVTNFADGTVSVLLNKGDKSGTFLPQKTLGTGLVHRVIAGDVNGDGWMDLIVPYGGSEEGLVGVLINSADGTGSFKTAVNYSAPPGGDEVAVGDLNGDGKLDLVCDELTANQVSVLLNTGVNGTLGTATTFGTGKGPEGLQLADMNGDGKLDVVVTNFYDNTLSVLLGKGDGTFGAQTTLATGAAPQELVLADLNGDGVLDILVMARDDNSIDVLFGKGDGLGSVLAPVPYPTGKHPGWIAVGDVNGDGLPDVVVANSDDNNVGVFLNKGAGVLLPMVTFVTDVSGHGTTVGSGGAGASVALSDVNGDGKLDVVTSNWNGNTLSVLLNMTP